MEEDAHLVIAVPPVDPGVLDLGLAAICGTGEVVVAPHSSDHVANDLQRVVAESEFRSTFAATGGDTSIHRVATLYCLMLNEVGHGSVDCWRD